jgi:hypothetical protein
MAHSDARAEEILSVWTSPGGGNQFVIKIEEEDPVVWGLLLVNAARHVALAYGVRGVDSRRVLARIREGFDVEWAHPTDTPVIIDPGTPKGPTN